jgi:hypothetical protein
MSTVRTFDALVNRTIDPLGSRTKRRSGPSVGQTTDSTIHSEGACTHAHSDTNYRTTGKNGKLSTVISGTMNRIKSRGFWEPDDTVPRIDANFANPRSVPRTIRKKRVELSGQRTWACNQFNGGGAMQWPRLHHLLITMESRTYRVCDIADG